MAQLRCRNCGREASTGTGDWARVEHPPLGTVTQCPDCGSTNLSRRR